MHELFSGRVELFTTENAEFAEKIFIIAFQFPVI